jgi:uncharacterized membrane protein YfcA
VLEYLWLIPLGFAVGVVGTLIGAGGGFVLLPILALMYPEDGPEIIATISLAVVFCNAASGSIAYGRMRRIDYKSGLAFAAATVPGAIIGALATGYLPRRAFDAILGVLLVAVSVFLVWRNLSRRVPSSMAHGIEAGPDGRPIADRMGTYNLPLGIGYSVLVGFLSSLLGLGGGIIHVPFLAHVLHFPVHVATATSHFVLAITALTGTVTHIVDGTFTQGVTRTVGLSIGVVAGAQLGAWVSSHVRGRWIVIGLAIALGSVGLRILLRAL